MSFEHFNLHEEVHNGLMDMGFEKPTPIQEACVPLILKGRDVLASAQTGTGKTAAFAIPVLEILSEKKKKNVQGIRALVITPTRELAGQVDEAFFAIGYHTGLTTAKVYGGDDWGRQEKALSKGTNIIVATPGRLLDHIKIHDVDFSNLDFLILDEADRMLDMGFIPDITQIVSKLPKNRQTLLFSATLPPKIVQLARKMMDNPERVNTAPDNTAAEGVSQKMYYIEERDKLPLVLRLFEKEQWASAIIFMSTKRAVDKLTRELTKKGADVTSIHGDRTQAEREQALESFRKGEYRIIVATDVMSRGIDVEGISHIINFSVPRDVEDYVHRIGRTARAEATGDAITLVSGQDRRYMENIIRTMKSEITKMEVPDLGQGDKKESKKSGQKPTRKSGQKHSAKGKKVDSGKEQSGKEQSGKEQSGKVDSGKEQKKTASDKGPGQQDGRDSKQEEHVKGQKQKDTGKSDSKARSDDRSAGEPDDAQRPKRRRGRKRPGGQRKYGKKPPKQQESAGAESDRKDKKQEQDKSAPDQSGESKSGRDQRKSKQQQPGKSDKDDRSRQKGGKPKGPRRGRKQTAGKPGSRGRQKPAGKDNQRKKLFDNVTSPDMDRVNKAVEKKRGVWSKIKGIFGGD